MIHVCVRVCLPVHCTSCKVVCIGNRNATTKKTQPKIKRTACVKFDDGRRPDLTCAVASLHVSSCHFGHDDDVLLVPRIPPRLLPASSAEAAAALFLAADIRRSMSFRSKERGISRSRCLRAGTCFACATPADGVSPPSVADYGACTAAAAFILSSGW